MALGARLGGDSSVEEGLPKVSRRGPRSRAKRARNTALLTLAAVSIIGHAAVIAFVQVDTPKFTGVLPTAMRAKPCVGANCPHELQTSCESDMLLAAGARLTLCPSPFASAQVVEQCVKSALARLELDLYQCREDPAVAGMRRVELEQIEEELLAPKPLMPDVPPQDDVQAAELIEKEVAEKIEQAQKEIQRRDIAGQVVEITRPQMEMAPDQARYLSEFDSATKKQTVARGSTEAMVERPAPRELPPTAKSNPDDPTAPPPDAKTPPPSTSTSKAPGQGPGSSPSTLAMRGPGSSAAETPAPPRTAPGAKAGEKVVTADGIAARAGEAGLWTRATGKEPPGGGEVPGGGETAKPPPSLRPSEELLERAVGGGSVDHIEDADEGEFTSLNSRKWKFATFFNRMKRQVAQNWHPDQVYLRRDPNGNIYGTKDRLTVLRVSLNPNGSVAKIYVAKQSGVDFLDDEAVRAFNEAQPFPNPPGGLVDARSNLITFSFGFHFQIGGDRSRWKVFRYQ
ncbi:MAG TPA: energy transducer TonB [Kofleriaceae bacterium]